MVTYTDTRARQKMTNVAVTTYEIVSMLNPKLVPRNGFKRASTIDVPNPLAKIPARKTSNTW
jgi:hypothetical protein